MTLAAASAVFFAARQNARSPGATHVGGDAPPAVDDSSRQPLPAYRLVNVNREDIPEGELSRGRVLVVYLTTSCGPCAEEVKIISRFVEAAPTDIRVYGLTFDRPSQVAAFTEEVGTKFPVLIDTGARVAKSLDLRYFPSMFLVEDGIITKRWTGVTRDEADLRRQLTDR